MFKSIALALASTSALFQAASAAPLFEQQDYALKKSDFMNLDLHVLIEPVPGTVLVYEMIKDCKTHKK